MGPSTLQIPENYPSSRSASSASSSRIDPYYFGESPSPSDFPRTPAKEIDRAALVGVGELATPRYVKEDRPDVFQDVDVNESGGTRDSDSPSGWTIEAIDGEMSEKEDLPDVKQPLRSRPSMTEESGGEEILYPRKSKQSEPSPPLPSDSSAAVSSPPSAFNQAPRRARKRTSDEFELDQTGSLVSKRATSISVKDKPKEDLKSSARKHRSLTATSISGLSPREHGKAKERRRESLGLNLSSSSKSVSSSSSRGPLERRHSRQSSTSSNPQDSVHSRRVQNTDFSHLPPSPSSSSIQQFIRTTSNGPTTPHTPPTNSPPSKELGHPSSNVAHSLLRGTQEGWSVMDDEATAEALRKLDGLSGKTARARASVGSFHRQSSQSRPGTPGNKSVHQWEGVEGSGKRRETRDSAISVKEQEPAQRPTIGMAILGDNGETSAGSAVSSDEQRQQVTVEKTPKKTGASSARSSFTPKRGSASSATIASTPTTSSRDSVTISAATSVTSVASGRPSTGNSKARRNSAGSDISSIHSSDANSLKDRVASLALSGEPSGEEGAVPPVPPLPKDLSNYRSPPSTAVGLSFPSSAQDMPRSSHELAEQERVVSLEVPTVEQPPPSSAKLQKRQSQRPTSSHASGSESATPAVMKTPSKKWSFSSALNLKLSSSPSVSSKHQSQPHGYPASPHGSGYTQQLRKSTSKDQAFSPSSGGGSKSPWSPTQPDAMGSATSLASLSSVGSVRTPAISSPLQTAPLSKTPDRSVVSSRAGTDSSASTNAGLAVPQHPSGPLSPSSSVRRHQSKRLTPSSIPFFRRSSSQSMPPPPSSSSPPLPSDSSMLSATARYKQSSSPGADYNPPSTTAGHRKSSVFTLPSLLKGSSSRKSLHSDAKESAKEVQKARDAIREAERRQEKEKEKQKKEDKDRSESRISTVLMGRKRGKTLSSTEPKKPKSPVHMPPMQISALEPVTAQRVARLKSSGAPASPSSSTPVTTRSTSSSSRATSQTASSMQKQSDASLRSRTQLPTIAGSPSVGTNNVAQTSKENKEPPSTVSNSISGLPKETPTKIPRISSRTSAAASPTLKGSQSTITARRTSTNVSTLTSSRNASPSGAVMNEFGVMQNDGQASPKTVGRTSSTRVSPAVGSTSTSRVPRQIANSTSATGSVLPRKSNRESISFTGLRKPSSSSVASVSTNATTANETSSSHHRFSALSPSKGLKLLSPKISLSSARSNANNTQHSAAGSSSASRQSLSTPSPAPSSVDDEELMGDEEMMHYIRRQQAKKLQTGSTQEELDELLKFPEPIPPGEPLSPQSILSSSQSQHLCEYERKEILDHPAVYYVGSRSKKNMATLDVSANNYGYDDDRGDYQVITRDHLAYRYEIVDTLGKGSFGQVLHCRDHCTGESVAIKIIRNKKRFHHQALVEIKILDSLRKWDSEEKHHVIKMTEHFYFRNHLCIAMELLSINLYELIKANGFVGFTTSLIRRFTSQMLLSLSLMRHHRIVHCDLKPENVLLRHPAKSAIKVIDFGSSCFEHEKIYTYIQSRFYRSPEVILGMNYHMAIDMWSLGCILAELYTGFPIFPGENEQEQLSCIMEVLGVPDKEFVNKSSRKKLFFEPNGAPRAVVNSKGRRRRPGTKTLAQVLRCNDEEFVDFIAKCLVWDPERRIKPQAALRHPFVTAGKRPKQVPASTSKSGLSTTSLSSRSKKELLETPKKSLISAPTPLTARSTRTTGNGVPTTPSSSTHNTTMPSSSRSYRASQAHSLSSHHSSRTLNGYVAAK
ncbi:serine/threonine protein kinase, CMGC, dual-specificity [Marasmius crinis-equi]|uniref:dual-specificity kinase n=1 Tax=Marasmius crinis-equi TaxID=585013 RepID=A0ABR3FSG8_9AGAR